MLGGYPDFGTTILMDMCESKQNQYQIIENLLKRGANPNIGGWITKKTPLMLGVYYSAVTKLLIRYGADPNAVDSKGYTALMYACISGNLSSIKALLKRGADISVIANNGKSVVSIVLTECDLLDMNWGYIPRFEDVLNENDCSLPEDIMHPDMEDYRKCANKLLYLIVTTLLKHGARVSTKNIEECGKSVPPDIVNLLSEKVAAQFS